MQGLVLKSTGSWLQVEIPDGRIIASRVRGQLRLRGISSTNPVAVGDRVEIEIGTDGTGVIIELMDRSNYIVRKSVKLSKQTQILAANIDRAWLVATPALPKTSMGFIDRFIAAAESFRIPAGLILNKSDIFKDELAGEMREYLDIYVPLGYPCICTSAITGQGLEELRAAISGKVNLLSGHSGVGKSSLINFLEPGLNLKTGNISLQHLKGKHTTTFAEMHKLGTSGYIIDTPGIREFVNIDFDPAEIGHFFIEIRNLMQHCKFNNCLHDLEKECAVKVAVDDGKIHPSRYHSYLSMLHQEDIYR
jgi:ribosome biogenesis GTPase